jgi:ABC-2 type transport system ATP-binding protein
VNGGECFGFLGLNGAGKTTTVRILTGTLPPTRGAARIHGVDVERQSEKAARLMGVVFGENTVPEPTFSAVRYLRYVGRLHGMPRTEVDRRIRTLVAALDLGKDAERPIASLSGGNRRKVEIARALLHGPRVLFLDEPTRELDILAKRAMWDLLRDLVDDEEITIFLSSHDVQEIAELCTRVGIIRDGVLSWEGTRAALTADGRSLIDALAERLQGPPAPPRRGGVSFRITG